jgi:N-acylglucosamine-6-phosphate 2-epimerase
VVLGGLAGETYWGWLYIDKLWLDESLRGRGLARELMQRAEIEAIQRGCRAAYLTTFSFQARGLYEKLGYRVVGQLDDYPPGATYYWMRKDFHRDSGADTV